ncbi:GIY-YIG catalytic domain-containin endonuclease [Only Syngen Nebraska virus 5]|uniref:GIY-YIG catalytic domain-containin endonuclease n=1 Tax=Only Syngen Nebraska virus 5 TaxID=1917232 RepID=UPI0009016608|nr:GIY-YIG catalytic domain-containin endonuclease [Only Syngen Nebraska virus 5]APC25634.1 GIY-YIG catalytic domain-containin endonuclease [Only Syngen Nebraska virus 5]
MGEYSYFYVWTRRKTGKQYVGVTTRPIDQRFKEHCKEDSTCTKLRNAIQKHGVGAFDFEYFEWMDPWDLAYIEKTLVDELESLSPNGYNLKEGGGNYGSLVEEVKQKMSEAQIGEKNPMYGKEHTEESKKKISESNTGKTRTEESKKKISEARIGMIFSEDHKKKISESNTGKTRTEESKKKISEAHKGDKNHRSKKVYQYTMDGTYIRPFSSCGEAGRHLGKGHSYIAACARGEREDAYTFRWSYFMIPR